MLGNFSFYHEYVVSIYNVAVTIKTVMDYVYFMLHLWWWDDFLHDCLLQWYWVETTTMNCSIILESLREGICFDLDPINLSCSSLVIQFYGTIKLSKVLLKIKVSTQNKIQKLWTNEKRLLLAIYANNCMIFLFWFVFSFNFNSTF